MVSREFLNRTAATGHPGPGTSGAEPAGGTSFPAGAPHDHATIGDQHVETKMAINLGIPSEETPTLLQPRILVVGIGGAGGNAVNNMIQSNLEGVEFLVANTDAQALASSRAGRTIQLGAGVTQGLGAGARPEVGRRAAEESMESLTQSLTGCNMAFITAGMGGGTGTGAAPVVAEAAREMGILTVGVVTKPFDFEGINRRRIAEKGIEELSQYVDTLIVIPNQNLFRVATEKTTFADAFKMADDVLYSGVRSVTDLMIMPGLINLDFADVRTVMSGMGKAMMGTGEAEGDDRGVRAAELAIANPLLDDTSMAGAKGVLINITGGPDLGLYEVDEAANRIRNEVDEEANIIFGSCFDEKLAGNIRVSVVATGLGGLIPARAGEPAEEAAAAAAPVIVRPEAPRAEAAAAARPTAADPLKLALFDRPQTPAEAFIPEAPVPTESPAVPEAARVPEPMPELRLNLEPRAAAPEPAAPAHRAPTVFDRLLRAAKPAAEPHTAQILAGPTLSVPAEPAVAADREAESATSISSQIETIPAFLRRQAN